MEATSLTVTLAYKFVAMLLMLIEVNQYASILNLETERSITVMHITGRSSVSPPKLRSGFGGSIVTSNYFFGFDEHRLRFVHHVEDFKYWKNFTSKSRFAQRSENIGTKAALRLATKQLTDLGIDMAAFEKIHPPSITNIVLNFVNAEWIKPVPGETYMLSLIEIDWGSFRIHPKTDSTRPVISMSLSAVDGFLANLRFEGPMDFVKRPLLRVHDIDALLAIKNEAFLKMTGAQRKSLFEKHARIPYPMELDPQLQRELSEESPKSSVANPKLTSPGETKDRIEDRKKP